MGKEKKHTKVSEELKEIISKTNSTPEQKFVGVKLDERVGGQRTIIEQMIYEQDPELKKALEKGSYNPNGMVGQYPLGVYLYSIDKKEEAEVVFKRGGMNPVQYAKEMQSQGRERRYVPPPKKED